MSEQDIVVVSIFFGIVFAILVAILIIQATKIAELRTEITSYKRLIHHFNDLKEFYKSEYEKLKNKRNNIDADVYIIT